jgi:hypothetical protein
MLPDADRSRTQVLQQGHVLLLSAMSPTSMQPAGAALGGRLILRRVSVVSTNC